MSPWGQILRDEAGQDMVEYGLLVAIFALLILLGMNTFGADLRAWFGELATKITAEPGG